MNREYHEYFEARFDAVRATSAELLVETGVTSDTGAQALVLGALSQAEQTAVAMNRRLRDDARLLLFVTFCELVAMPILQVRPEVGADLGSDVAHDMSLIVGRAVTTTDELELSSHAIFDAISSLWPEFLSAKHKVWD
jgi:hypothetical protein